MSPRERVNGGEDPFPSVPTRNPVPERRPLSEAFSPIEAESVTGVIARRLVDQVGALVTRADRTSADVRALGDATVRGFNEIKVLLRLPPMRAESPSSDAVPVHARKSFGEFLQQQAKSTPGGPGVVQAPPEELEQAAQRYFEEQMAVYERGQELKRLQAQETQQKADREKRASDRRTLIILTVSGTIAALAGVLGTYFATKASEHESAFIEGFKAAPVMAPAIDSSFVVQVLPGASAAGTAGKVPQAPAAAAPAR